MVSTKDWPLFTREQAAKVFGPINIKDGIWGGATKWCTLLPIPESIAKGWLNPVVGKPTSRIYVNQCMAFPLLRALNNVEERGRLHELKTFDGCFNVRDTRGAPGTLSWHAYALALDINARENALGAKPQLSAGLVACFTDEGFLWGGDFGRPDGMHFQWGLD